MFMYAKHGNLVDASACLEVIQGRAFLDR